MLELEKAKGVIYSQDLEEVKQRLVKIENWKVSEADQAIAQYRNYLFLRLKYQDITLPPSKEIDEVWHAHVLHTKNYRDFCRLAFRHEKDQYLDHHPHIATAKSLNDLRSAFEKTQNFYYKEFGEYIYQIRGKSFVRKGLEWLVDRLTTRFPNFKARLEH